MEQEELIPGFILELRRGTLILCVLSQMKKPAYGYSLIDALRTRGVPIETNTLYPLLRRLETQGLLESQWNTQGAKPRKYYVITHLGKEVYTQLRTHWYSTVANVNILLGEDEENDGSD